MTQGFVAKEEALPTSMLPCAQSEACYPQLRTTAILVFCSGLVHRMALGTTGIQLPSPSQAEKQRVFSFALTGKHDPSSLSHKGDWALLISCVV